MRKNLLAGLHAADVLTAPTLESFRSAGFLFDHAIRCRLPSDVIDKERRAAMRYASHRAAAPEHLRPLIHETPIVWAMGYLAPNAIANLIPEFPRARDRISESPRGSVLPDGKLVFVSRYFTRISEDVAVSICQRFVRFAQDQGVTLRAVQGGAV